MVTYKRNSVFTFLPTQPLRVGMIETRLSRKAVQISSDPTPAGWDDWNKAQVQISNAKPDPAPAGWDDWNFLDFASFFRAFWPSPRGLDDWNFRYNASASSVQDPALAGWDDWSTEFVRDINDIQDSTHMGWDDWNGIPKIYRVQKTTQPSRAGWLKPSG